MIFPKPKYKTPEEILKSRLIKIGDQFLVTEKMALEAIKEYNEQFHQIINYLSRKENLDDKICESLNEKNGDCKSNNQKCIGVFYCHNYKPREIKED